MRVFVAGASGAIGEPLIAELLKQGHSVVGMTASETRAKILEGQGASAEIVDAFDAAAVEAALRRSKAEVVIDELTSLPKDPGDMRMRAQAWRRVRGRIRNWRRGCSAPRPLRVCRCDMDSFMDRRPGITLASPRGTW